MPGKRGNPGIRDVPKNTVPAVRQRVADADALASRLLDVLLALARDEGVTTCGRQAKRLNELGFRNLDGRPWTRQTVLRYRRRIRDRKIAPASGYAALVLSTDLSEP